jgi:hypothetical protein
MNDAELEAWLASRLGDAPSPQPSARLAMLVHAGRRPGRAKIRRPSLRGLGAVAGLAACVVLAGGLLLGFSGRLSPNSAASGSPVISPTPTPTATASSPPSPSPALTPTATATPVVATVVARIAACQNPLGWEYGVSGSDLFVVCSDDGSWPYVARVDLTTNKVSATYRYKTTMTYIEDLAVVDGSLWFDGTFGSACIPGGCDGFRHLERFDVATGKNTLDTPNEQLEVSALGSVWVRDVNGGTMATQGRLTKLDPRTGKETASIPFDMDAAWFACGSLWGITRNGWATADTSTTLARIDPTDGAILARFTIPGLLEGLQSVGGACWAPVAPGGTDLYSADYADHFVRIGESGVEYTSPQFDLNDHAGGPWWTSVDVQGGAFWLVSDDLDSSARLQRLDPSTWQPSGPTWQTGASGYQGDPFAIIDGSVWVFDNDGGISRLAIPLGP